MELVCNDKNTIINERSICIVNVNTKRIIDIIDALRSGSDASYCLNKLKEALGLMYPDKEFSVSICKSEGAKFFGVNVFPTINAMDAFVTTVTSAYDSDDRRFGEIKNLWDNFNIWAIELDHELLYGTKLNASNEEIASVLFYEIYRVVYNEALYSTVFAVIEEVLFSIKYDLRKMISTTKIRKIFNVLLIEACAIKNFPFDVIPIELDDGSPLSYINNMAYKTFVDKVLRAEGNGRVNLPYDEFCHQIKILGNWVLDAALKLRSSKSDLRRALKVESMRTPSNIIKLSIEDIHRTLFGDILEKFTVTEAAKSYTKSPSKSLSMNILHSMADSLKDPIGTNIKSYQSLTSITKEMKETFYEGRRRELVAAMEKAKNAAVLEFIGKFGKMKKVNQFDIDVIETEMDRIETPDDKVYVLDKIYIQLDKVNASLDMLEEDPSRVTQSKQTLEKMKHELEIMKTNTLAKKIIPKEYGVFIKYPKGYQG